MVSVKDTAFAMICQMVASPKQYGMSLALICGGETLGLHWEGETVSLVDKGAMFCFTLG